jgi:hypothetical protein
MPSQDLHHLRSEPFSRSRWRPHTVTYSIAAMTDSEWPDLSGDDWVPTISTLHRWMQIVGKTRLRLAPFQNHWWHCTLYVTARGVTTSPMPYAHGNVEVEFNFLSDTLAAHTSDGQTRSFGLESKSVAQFYDEYLSLLRELDVDVRISGTPNELADATPFAEDHGHASYDGTAARRWWGALTQADRALKEFRGKFLGKSSPSQLWWGALDIAATRFSGRTAPQHPGGVANCPDYVMHEGYSHECISAGWWAGTPGSPVSSPSFYAYVYPEPEGLAAERIEPESATYSVEMREWLLPYDAVRASPDPDATIARFLESTYEVAAKLNGWQVAALRASSEHEVAKGQPRVRDG